MNQKTLVWILTDVAFAVCSILATYYILGKDLWTASLFGTMGVVILVLVSKMESDLSRMEAKE